MNDNDKSIYIRNRDKINDNIDKQGSEGVVKSLISLIPFAGELVNSIVPDLYALFKHQAFNEYLNGINLAINNSGFSEDDRSDFKEKIQDADNYSHLTSIVDGVFFSKSKRARMILGVITANYIRSSSIPYEDLIIIDALKDLLDDDIDSFLKIYDVAVGGGREDENGEGAFFFGYYPEQITINTAFSKLKRLHIFGDKANWLTSKSPNSWHGNFTSITKKLKRYIEFIDGERDNLT